VTDFPRQEERYVPFVSDFPSPATPAEPAPSSGVDWSGLPLEGVGVTLAAALTAGALLLLARRRTARLRLNDC
jgi:hypothetical protein